MFAYIKLFIINMFYPTPHPDFLPYFLNRFAVLHENTKKKYIL